jgi:hypothetical protein
MSSTTSSSIAAARCHALGLDDYSFNEEEQKGLKLKRVRPKQKKLVFFSLYYSSN